MSERPRILVTCFEPFGGSAVNPTMLIAHELAQLSCAHGSRAFVTLPVIGGTEHESAWSRVLPVLNSFQPDAVVALGESAKAECLNFESVAVNLRSSRIPDNAGVQVLSMPVIADAHAELQATLPLALMMEASESSGVSAVLSLSAGTFLCNELMYRLLAHASATPPRQCLAGFVHVPQLPEQALERGGPSLPASTSAHGIHAAIEALAHQLARERVTA